VGVYWGSLHLPARDPRMNDTAIERLTYTVPGVSCGHCRAAIVGEIEQTPGVHAIDVDLDAKRVTVVGDRLDDAAVRAAIDEAGYDIA
jgi:copper chaperone